MNKKHLNAINRLLLFLLSLSVWGCSKGTMPPLVETGKTPHVYGSVDSIQNNGNVFMMLVNGNPQRPAIYDEAVVLVDEKTSVFRNIGGRYTRISIDNVRVGNQVAVYFTEPIATSFPIQGRAVEIIVE